jgi:hypothetical protein
MKRDDEIKMMDADIENLKASLSGSVNRADKERRMLCIFFLLPCFCGFFL